MAILSWPAAHYVDALHVADRQIATADEYRLAFALLTLPRSRGRPQRPPRLRASACGYCSSGGACSSERHPRLNGLRPAGTDRPMPRRDENCTASFDSTVGAHSREAHDGRIPGIQSHELRLPRRYGTEWSIRRGRAPTTRNERRDNHVGELCGGLLPRSSPSSTMPRTWPLRYALVRSTGGFDALVVGGHTPWTARPSCTTEESREELSSLLSVQ